MDGYSTPELCRYAGLTYRMADYWARIGVLRPSLAEPHGSGAVRRYSLHDLRLARVLAELRRLGVSLDLLDTLAASLSMAADPLEHGTLYISPDGQVTRHLATAEAWPSHMAVRLHLLAPRVEVRTPALQSA